MATQTAPISLQDARKAFARRHICDAARDLFYRNGYTATTFDQIASASGTRRTTLYSHFADKLEILHAIAEEYYVALCAVVETLPGPIPARAEIEAWLDRLVALVVRERTPASLVIGLGVGQDAPVIHEMSARFRVALSARIPAFARALAPEAKPHDEARARMVMREISLACLEAATDDSRRAMLGVAADLFEAFVRDAA